MELIDALQTTGIDYKIEGQHHHARRGWVQLDCPQCSANSQRYRLGWHQSGRYANCWSCGMIPVHLLCRALGIDVSSIDFQPVKNYARHVEPHLGRYHFPCGFVTNETGYTVHRKYLARRGFDPKQLELEWGIRYVGRWAPHRLQWSIYMPIHFEGQLVSWIARTIKSQKQRYLKPKPNEESIRIGRLLYGWDHVKNSVIVVEGPTDAWAIGHGAVATMGTSYTQAQELLLRSIPNRVICFDNEPAAQKRARQMAEALSIYPGKTRVVELHAKDAAEAHPREIKQLRGMLNG